MRLVFQPHSAHPSAHTKGPQRARPRTPWRACACSSEICCCRRMGRPDLPEQICDPEGFGEEPELQECCRRNCSLQGVRRALSKSARRRREGALTRAILAEGLLGALRARETRTEGSSGTAPTRETRRTIGDSFKVE